MAEDFPDPIPGQEEIPVEPTPVPHARPCAWCGARSAGWVWTTKPKMRTVRGRSAWVGGIQADVCHHHSETLGLYLHRHEGDE